MAARTILRYAIRGSQRMAEPIPPAPLVPPKCPGPAVCMKKYRDETAAALSRAQECRYTEKERTLAEFSAVFAAGALGAIGGLVLTSIVV